MPEVKETSAELLMSINRMQREPELVGQDCRRLLEKAQALFPVNYQFDANGDVVTFYQAVLNVRAMTRRLSAKKYRLSSDGGMASFGIGLGVPVIKVAARTITITVRFEVPPSMVAYDELRAHLGVMLDLLANFACGGVTSIEKEALYSLARFAAKSLEFESEQSGPSAFAHMQEDVLQLLADLDAESTQPQA